MKAIATFHQPSSVVSSLKTRLLEDEDTEFLVVAKSSLLEVFSILPDSLRLQCTLEIWGRITSIHALPVGETSQHRLLVLTDHPDPRLVLLGYVQRNAESRATLETFKSISLYERNARPAEFLNTCLVDHRGKIAIGCSYTGKLRVLELQDGLISTEFDTSIRELNILSLCFLRTTNARATVLAILYKDYLQKLNVTSHDLSISDLELSHSPSSFLPEFSVSDSESKLLVPVPPQTRSSWNINGGILVVGGSNIAFYSIDRKQKKKNSLSTPKPIGSKLPQAEVAWPFFDITAWSQVDEEGTRFLLGDCFGRLALLALDLERPMLDILFLGEVSPPTSLTPLASQYIFVGSHFGDSQLVRLVKDKSSASGTYIDISETFKNIAPIMDAIAEDIDGSGQSTIVTCSGGESSGSLRIIRNGANFTEDALVDGIWNVFGIWPLKRHYDDEYHQFVVVSTDTSSHLLRLPEAQHESSVSRSDELADLRCDAPTLVSANVLDRIVSDTGKSQYVSGSHVLQVTRDVVQLLDTQTGLRESEWFPEDRKIILADASPSQVCIALSGGLVVLLNIRGDRIFKQSDKTFIDSSGSFSEISALSVKPAKSSAKFSLYAVLGFWSSNEVRIYKLPTFEPVGVVPVVMPHLPRSLLLYDFGDSESGSSPHLLVGLANGTVVSMQFDGKVVLGEKKYYALGGTPVSLAGCQVNNQPAVLASGTRSALIYRSKDSLNHSPVLIKDVNSASSINTNAFASSMILSTHNGLVIGRILELDKLHIRTVFMGKENPTKMAYHPGAKMFGVGCLKVDRGVSKGTAAASSSFKLIDAVDFRATHEFSLEADEEISAVATVSLESGGDWMTFFAVGSTYFDESEREPTRGRILLFSAGSSRTHTPHIFVAKEVKGAVNVLTSAQGRLVAAINTSVDIFSLVSGDSHELKALTSWNHNYLVISIAVIDDRIVVGDAVSSLLVLRLEDDKLSTLARDYSPLWPLCIGMFDKQTIVGANNDNNVFSYRLEQKGSKLTLEQDGLYNIDEIVNKCVPGSFDTSQHKFGLEPKNLLFTTTGRISVVVDVNTELSRLLSSLERNLAEVVKGPGDVNHTLYRAPSNSRGRSDGHAAATGFLDGDLLERFLDYPPDSIDLRRILSGKNEAEKIDASYSRLRTILQSLRSIH